MFIIIIIIIIYIFYVINGLRLKNGFIIFLLCLVFTNVSSCIICTFFFIIYFSQYALKLHQVS
jgi:hypothetical protein